MPCFYCGKNVPVFRRLTDPDFCSDEHRQRYHELTKLALERLVQAAPPKEARPGEKPAASPQAAEPAQAGPIPVRVHAGCDRDLVVVWPQTQRIAMSMGYPATVRESAPGLPRAPSLPMAPLSSPGKLNLRRLPVVSLRWPRRLSKPSASSLAISPAAAELGRPGIISAQPGRSRTRQAAERRVPAVNARTALLPRSPDPGAIGRLGVESAIRPALPRPVVACEAMRLPAPLSGGPAVRFPSAAGTFLSRQAVARTLEPLPPSPPAAVAPPPRSARPAATMVPLHSALDPSAKPLLRPSELTAPAWLPAGPLAAVRGPCGVEHGMSSAQALSFKTRVETPATAQARSQSHLAVQTQFSTEPSAAWIEGRLRGAESVAPQRAITLQGLRSAMAGGIITRDRKPVEEGGGPAPPAGPRVPSGLELSREAASQPKGWPSRFQPATSITGLGGSAGLAGRVVACGVLRRPELGPAEDVPSPGVAAESFAVPQAAPLQTPPAPPGRIGRAESVAPELIPAAPPQPPLASSLPATIALEPHLPKVEPPPQSADLRLAPLAPVAEAAAQGTIALPAVAGWRGSLSSGAVSRRPAPEPSLVAALQGARIAALAPRPSWGRSAEGSLAQAAFFRQPVLGAGTTAGAKTCLPGPATGWQSPPLAAQPGRLLAASCGSQPALTSVPVRPHVASPSIRGTLGLPTGPVASLAAGVANTESSLAPSLPAAAPAVKQLSHWVRTAFSPPIRQEIVKGLLELPPMTPASACESLRAQTLAEMPVLPAAARSVESRLRPPVLHAFSRIRRPAPAASDMQAAAAGCAAPAYAAAPAVPHREVLPVGAAFRPAPALSLPAGGRRTDDPRSRHASAASPPAAPRLATPGRTRSAAARLEFPHMPRRAAASRPQRGPVAPARQPAGQPLWRTRLAAPSAVVQPVTVTFEVPPAPPVWAPLLEVWKQLPSWLRAAAVTLVGFGVLSFLLWLAAGEAVGEQLRQRAAIEISEDFRGGLAAWTGARDWSSTWSRNPSGYVEVGQLALLRPTRRLSDYQFEFLGQITNKSLGWVYRAGDLENYYAMKLTLVKPGPLPSVVLVRYAVVGGREQQRVQIPVRVVVHNQAPVRVRFEAKGDAFTTWISGQIVDFWRDDRFSRGAVGFFGEKDDRPQIYWIRVSHQNDFLGKLCAYLAPSDEEVPNP